MNMKNTIALIFAAFSIVGCSTDVEKCVDAAVRANTDKSSTEKDKEEIRSIAYMACLRASKGE
jgi:hypothetical protein